MTPVGELIEDLRLLEPPNPWLIYYWVGGAIALLLLILIVRALVRRRRRVQEGMTPAEIRAVQRDAAEALENLHPLIEQEQGKQYAIQSTGVIREYIERRFAIRAPMRSTDEFLHDAQHAPELPQEFHQSLTDYLRGCDLLKFGRGIANRAELEAMHAAALRFVKTTRQEAAPQ